MADLVDLGLRFDLTIPLARYFANNEAKLPVPFRALQTGPVWRAERPQKGRYRQFVQCDIDIIGEPSVLAEIELISATSFALRGLGIDEGTIKISDRRLLLSIARHSEIVSDSYGAFFVALDKLDRVGWDGVREELAKRAISASSIDRVVEITSQLANAPVEDLPVLASKFLPSLDKKVVDDLCLTILMSENSGELGNMKIVFDPALARGMGYYTGQIFEIKTDKSDSSIAGGGRYDDLIGGFKGKPVPACGFSIGFERILELLGDIESQEGLALLFDNEVDVETLMTTAAQFRHAGYDVSVIRRSGSIKAQTERLAQWRFAAFVYFQAGKESEGLPSVQTLSVKK